MGHFDHFTIVTSSRVVTVDVTFVNVVEGAVGATAAAAEGRQGRARVVGPTALGSASAVSSGWLGSSVHGGPVGSIGWARARGT